HQRPLVGEVLEEAPPGGESLLSPVATALRLGREPDERPQVRLDPRVVDRVVELARRLLLGLALEDPRVRLHHLAERPEGDAVAVRQAAPVAPRRERFLLLQAAVQLEDEPALADTRHADQRHELRRALLACEVERAYE